jgi:hypothetical protein
MHGADWNVQTLYAFFEAAYQEIGRDVESRFAANEVLAQSRRNALEIALKAVEDLASLAHTDIEKSILKAERDTDRRFDAAALAAEKAVQKAETATDKRFESVNEFRKTLSDQTALFVPRTEVDKRFDAVDEFRSRSTTTIAAFVPRGEIEAGLRAINDKLASEVKSINERLGALGLQLTAVVETKNGARQNWAMIAMAISITALIVGIVMTFVRFAGGK